MSACTANPDAQALNAAQGEVMVLAQALQTDAPALAARGGVVTAVWVGADERGVHQDARQVSGAAPGDVVTLPLPPTHPYDQRLITSDGGRLHLFWLDADATGQTTLFSAMLSADLSVERGPVALSDGLALRYSAVSDGLGGAWVVWSGGALTELNVYARQLDADGRPLQTIQVADNATDPALLRTAEGAIWGFWLAAGQVIAQRLDVASTPQMLTSAISLAAGDRLIDTGAALDRTEAIYYWNVTRANGESETWITSGVVGSDSWTLPQRLSTQSSNLSWFIPLSNPSQTLQGVAQSADGLALVTLRGGAISAVETLVPDVQLIGLSAITADEQGARYVAWSAADLDTATLYLMPIK